MGVVDVGWERDSQLGGELEGDVLGWVENMCENSKYYSVMWINCDF